MRTEPDKEPTPRLKAHKLSRSCPLLVVCLFLLTATAAKCLKVDTASLEKSGWKVVDTWPPMAASQRRQPTRDLSSRESYSLATAKSNSSTRGKLIEWDDDDAGAHHEHHTSERTRPLRNQSITSMHSSSTTTTAPSDRFNGGLPRANLMNSLMDNRLERPSTGPQSKSNWWPDNLAHQRKNPKLNRLVFHSQLRNDTRRVVDGIEYHIRTHNPVSINRLTSSKTTSRRPFESESEHIDEIAVHEGDDQEDPLTTVVPPAQPSRGARGSKTSPTVPSAGTEVVEQSSKGKRRDELLHKSVFSSEIGSSSDWRPITFVSRARRSGKSSVNRFDARPEETGTKMNGSSIKLDYSWKPLKTKLPITSFTDKLKSADWLSTTAATPYQRLTANKQSVIYGRKTIASPYRYEPSPDSLQGPFEDVDGVITMTRADSEDTRAARSDESPDESQVESGRESVKTSTKREGVQRGSKAQTESDNRWTPVETTTLSIETTTMPPPTTTTLLSNLPTGNTNSSEQRSASDLNYIYSSQPVLTQQQTQSVPASLSSSSSSSSYYSNYLIQPSPAQQISPPSNEPQQPTATIVDTVSGQTPEMIDRDNPPASNPADYSMLPQPVVAQFQPQAARQPPVAHQYSYDNNAYGPRPQQQQQPRQSNPTPPAQMIRQEHHYHYYNNNNQPQQPQRDLQDQRQQSFSNNQAPPSQTIMRELQPLVLSQPIIQQITPPSTTTTTTTTTPAPQIIREIVRELPFPQMPNIQRLLIPQVPPIPLPLPLVAPPPVPLVQREATPPVFEPTPMVSISSAYAPAQRIIRQLSNSMPSVSIRVPQLKLAPPAPAPVAIPLRAAALMPTVTTAGSIRGLSPVTRHAGSYVIPSVPKQTTTYLTETQAMPTHTTIMQTTQYTPASRTTVYTTDHQTAPQTLAATTSSAYAKSR